MFSKKQQGIDWRCATSIMNIMSCVKIQKDPPPHVSILKLMEKIDSF